MHILCIIVHISCASHISRLSNIAIQGENYHGFCHSSCDAGVRDPAIVFGNIKTFLETNKQEVLILIFEVQDNSLEQLYKAIDDSELDTMVYTERLDEWPTMQQESPRLFFFVI